MWIFFFFNGILNGTEIISDHCHLSYHSSPAAFGAPACWPRAVINPPPCLLLQITLGNNSSCNTGTFVFVFFFLFSFWHHLQINLCQQTVICRCIAAKLVIPLAYRSACPRLQLKGALWSFVLPGSSLRLAIAAARWLSYSTKAKPRFFDLSAALGYTMTSVTPSVTFLISHMISSRFLVLGIPPTNKRQLSTLAQTPRRRPFLRRWSENVLSYASKVEPFQGWERPKSPLPHFGLALASPDLVVVELLHRCFGLLFVAEGDEGVASVVPAEVHHHPHLVDLTKLRKARAVLKTNGRNKEVASPPSPSHTAAPVHPQTDLWAASPQRFRSPSLVEDCSSRVEGRRSAAGRSPETQWEGLTIPAGGALW